MSGIPIQAPMPSGSLDDIPFTLSVEQLLALYQGSGYGYFSGSGVFNFQGLGQYRDRTESTIQWIHVVADEAPLPSPVLLLTPEPNLVLVLFLVILLMLVARALGVKCGRCQS